MRDRSRYRVACRKLEPRVRFLPDAARASLVSAMSSVAAAAETRSGDSLATAVSGTLREIHLVSVLHMAPGDEQLVAGAEPAIGSSVAECCAPLSISSPSLSGGSTAAASFSLPTEAFAELVGGLAAEDAAHVGVMTVQWEINPWATAEVERAEQPVSLSLTAGGAELTVSNLSSPILLSLPSDRDAPSECRYFDEELATWTAAGLRVVRDDDGAVECASDHLTAFVVAALSAVDSRADDDAVAGGGPGDAPLGDCEALGLDRDWSALFGSLSVKIALLTLAALWLCALACSSTCLAEALRPQRALGRHARAGDDGACATPRSMSAMVHAILLPAALLRRVRALARGARDPLWRRLRAL